MNTENMLHHSKQTGNANYINLRYYYIPFRAGKVSLKKTKTEPHSMDNWQERGEMGFFSTAGGHRIGHVPFEVIGIAN